MKLVQKLLENAQYAVEIQGDVKPYIIDRLHRMNGESAAQRLVSLLDILVKISERGDLNPVLSSTLPKGGSTEAGGDQEISRINTIFDYITNNFRREIYVHEIAEKLFMSKASFSRFFKHHTRKTFSDYVTEMRISHACKLLMNEDQNITQISFESGFENLSNFYKHFRRITGVIPKEYRRRFLETGL